MAIHKLTLEDFISIDYELIGIRSRIEDYKLAYLLNRFLNLKLRLENEEVQVKKKETIAGFSHYSFQDEDNSLNWRLLKNKTIVSTKSSSVGLFDETDEEVFLVSKFKTADYILKIEDIDSYFEIDTLIHKIKNIAGVETCFKIDQLKLKNNTNLIF